MRNQVVILGAAGFIGRHTSEMLAASGHDVVAATRRPAAFLHSGIRTVNAAFDDPTQFFPLLDSAQWVIHAASSSTPGSSSGRPLMELDGNLRTTLSLIEALQQFPKCKLLYLSSGGTLYGNHPESMAAEGEHLRPRSYYGAGKAAAEHFIQAWAAQYERTAVALRPSNVYGPGQPPNRGFGIVPAAMDNIVYGKPLSIWGDGSAMRDYLYIDDLTDLVSRVLSHEFTKEMHLYNASAGDGICVTDLLDAIDRATGKTLVRHYASARIADVHRTIPDQRAAFETFGWRAQTPLAAGLEKTWKWFAAMYGAGKAPAFVSK